MEKRPHLIPSLIVAIMLFIAITDLPYGYFQLLRWLTCADSILVAVLAYRWNKSWASWIFIVIAILFNPIFPITFSKATWRPIDIICGIIFMLVVIFIRKPVKEET